MTGMAAPVVDDAAALLQPLTLRERYESLIEEGTKHPHKIPTLLDELRRLVLLEGLPTATADAAAVRPKLWKIFLRVGAIDADAYIGLVEKGRSSVYDKIRNDTFRTLKSDAVFLSRVSEDKLIRVLNAFANGHATTSTSTHSQQQQQQQQQQKPPLQQHQPSMQFSYVQGMNVLLAPLLYVMTEVEAFYSFDALLTSHCPMYSALI
eukprot:Opistho-2@18382